MTLDYALTMANLVGPKIREARYRDGKRVTQQQLCARLQTVGIDIDRTAISKIESGRRPVTDIEIAAICQTLDVDPDWLFSWPESGLQEAK